MKALKFDARAKASPISIVVFVAIASVIIGGISQGLRFAAKQAETRSTAQTVDPNSPQGLVGSAYDDFLASSNQTHRELVKARALTILQSANQQPQPIIWLREKAIASETALRVEVNANLIWSPESIRRVNTLQFDLEAYGLLLKALTNGNQSSITTAPDLLTLSKRIEALRGTWDTQYVERRFPDE